MNFGQYQMVRLLGKGGMSEVYEVEDTRLGSRHALKLYTYEKNDPEVRERFLVEGRLLARFNHPRVVKVIDIGEVAETGAPYLVMDLVLDDQGEVKSLGEVEPGTVDEETVGQWYDDIREGLAYIHGQGVIHRDLKLQNVLIGPDGHAVLTDFGVSKVVGTGEKGQTVVDAVKTLVSVREGRNLVMGSVGYMAPELEMGVAASRESDWYALGVIVYRLLTGTWCDARTDVQEMLQTYDPVWKRIIPGLLHSNPGGRECRSYAEERKLVAEERELKQEEKLLKARARGRFARHLLRGMVAVAIVLAGVLGYGLVARNLEQRQLRLSGVGSPSPYEFDSIFAIPKEVKAEEQSDEDGNVLVPSREDLGMARIDLLVLTYQQLARLRTGAATISQVVADFEQLQSQFAEDDFSRWPVDSYNQVGDNFSTAWLLAHAIERLRELGDE